MSIIRVGFIGCGGNASGHVGRILAMGECEVVGLCDVSETSIERVRERHREQYPHIADVPVFADYREMLDNERPDIVSICTWHPFHAEMTVAAASRKPQVILCEKPMAINLGEAESMIDACDHNGVKLVVGHQRRFEAIYTEAQKLIADGIVGQPITVTRRVGSGLLNWGTHVIDLTRQILGDPETKWVIGQVERKTDRYERRCAIEDLCASIICFENDTRLILEIDMPPPHINNIFVHGSDCLLYTSDAADE